MTAPMPAERLARIRTAVLGDDEPVPSHQHALLYAAQLLDEVGRLTEVEAENGRLRSFVGGYLNRRLGGHSATAALEAIVSGNSAALAEVDHPTTRLRAHDEDVAHHMGRADRLQAEVDRLRAEAEAATRKPNDVPPHEVGKVRIVEEAVAFARRLDDATPEMMDILQSRHDVGMRRYGIPLTEMTPIDARAYALEEVADLLVYATLGVVRDEPWADAARDFAYLAFLCFTETDEVPRG